MEVKGMEDDDNIIVCLEWFSSIIYWFFIVVFKWKYNEVVNIYKF